MTRRPRKPPPPTVAVQTTGMWALLTDYIEWLRVRNYSTETARSRSSDIRKFLTWCDERSLTEPTAVTQPILERYQRWLYYHRLPSGRPLTFRSQHHILTSVKSFFRWMTRQHLTLFNPAAELDMPRYGQRLPRDVLTAAETEAVLAQPDVTDLRGLRDRAILETFYSTGVRRKELARLALYDLEQSRGTLMVREGKGDKDRVVPIGDRARAWIAKYLADVRPALATEPDDGTLFLTTTGKRFELSMLSELVRKYIVQAKVPKKGGCHIFRHTAATLMLENGADVRYIQELLGHGRLSTTEIYTHVSITKLQQIHKATHPAEQPRPVPPTTSTAAAELLAALDQEDDAEPE